MTFFDLVLRTVASLHPHGEPDDFISEYIGVIRCQDDSGTVRRVGKIRAWRINAALAENHGERWFDVCDAHSQELHVVHTLLYDPRGMASRNRSSTALTRWSPTAWSSTTSCCTRGGAG
jgi:hypothetical protein